MSLKDQLSDTACVMCDSLLERKREVQGYNICPECADSVARNIKNLNTHDPYDMYVWKRGANRAKRFNWELLGQVLGACSFCEAMRLASIAYVMTVLLFSF